MPKIQVEIEDNLQERVNEAIDLVKDALIEYIEDNNPDYLPCLHNDLDYSGAIHEIIDGAVPVYTSDINNAFFLHGQKIEQAFDDSGIGEKDDNGWPNGWKAAAMYSYIETKVNEWYSEEAQDVFKEHIGF